MGNGTRTNWTLSGLLFVCLMGMVAGGFRVEMVLGFVLGFLVVVVVVAVLGLDVLGFGVVVVVVTIFLVVGGRRVVVVVVDGLPVVLGLTVVDVRVARGALITSGLAESGRRGVD